MVGDLAILGHEKNWRGCRAAYRRNHGSLGRYSLRTYAYLNVVDNARGGLEHLDSTLMIAKPFVPRSRKAYLGWLGSCESRILSYLECETASP